MSRRVGANQAYHTPGLAPLAGTSTCVLYVAFCFCFPWTRFQHMLKCVAAALRSFDTDSLFGPDSTELDNPQSVVQPSGDTQPAFHGGGPSDPSAELVYPPSVVQLSGATQPAFHGGGPSYPSP